MTCWDGSRYNFLADPKSWRFDWNTQRLNITFYLFFCKFGSSECMATLVHYLLKLIDLLTRLRGPGGASVILSLHAGGIMWRGCGTLKFRIPWWLHVPISCCMLKFNVPISLNGRDSKFWVRPLGEVSTGVGGGTGSGRSPVLQPKNFKTLK